MLTKSNDELSEAQQPEFSRATFEKRYLLTNMKKIENLLKYTLKLYQLMTCF